MVDIRRLHASIRRSSKSRIRRTNEKQKRQKGCTSSTDSCRRSTLLHFHEKSTQNYGEDDCVKCSSKTSSGLLTIYNNIIYNDLINITYKIKNKCIIENIMSIANNGYTATDVYLNNIHEFESVVSQYISISDCVS